MSSTKPIAPLSSPPAQSGLSLLQLLGLLAIVGIVLAVVFKQWA